MKKVERRAGWIPYKKLVVRYWHRESTLYRYNWQAPSPSVARCRRRRAGSGRSGKKVWSRIS